MTQTQKRSECKTMCWIIAAIAGIVLMLLLYKLFGLGGFWSFVLGLIGGVLLAYFLPQYMCKDSPASLGADTSAADTVTRGPVDVGQNSPAVASAVTGDTGTTNASAPSAHAAVASSAATTSTSATSSGDAGAVAPAAPLMAAEIKPSTPLAGEAELASRKGTWKYEAPAAEAKPAAKKPAAKKVAAKKTAVAETASADMVPEKAAPKKTTAKKAAASTAKPAKAKAAPKAKTAAAKAAPKAKAEPKAKAAPKPKATAAKAPAKATTKRAPVAADGKPLVYETAPPEGSDDLKLISGVGPKLEQTLNELGIYRFDQVAGWRKKEIEWVDARLRFKGRIARDDWMSQAKILAKGGETEFSKRKKT